MRRTLFLSLFSLFLLVSCDPKVNERGARYDPNDCPACKTGACSYCEGSKSCAHCDGKGNRTTSTKNYTGEGVKLVDVPEPCPFCKATGVCSYCEGTGKCHTCDGTGKSSDWESKRQKAKPSVIPAAVDSSAAPIDTTRPDSTVAQ